MLCFSGFHLGSHAQSYISSVEEPFVLTGENLYTNEALTYLFSMVLGAVSLVNEGSFTNVGISNLQTAALQFSGNNAQKNVFGSNDQTQTIYVDKIENQVTTNPGILNVPHKLQSNTLLASSYLTLKCNTITTAIVDQGVTVKHYIPTKRAYGFVSSPVTTSTSINVNCRKVGGERVLVWIFASNIQFSRT